jgi:hypothetical protein
VPGSGGVASTGGIVGSGGATTCAVTSNDCGARTCGTGTDNCGRAVSCGSCGTNQDCANNSACLPANLIDDFADCDNAIYAMGGRRGSWYTWANRPTTLISEGATGTAPPPSTWGAYQCAAWITGGMLSASGNEDGGMGVTLNNKSTYDACKYSGIEVTYASANPVTFRFKYGASVKYAYATLPATTSSSTQRVTFPSGACSQLLDIQFIPYDFESFGYAVFKVSLY